MCSESAFEPFVLAPELVRELAERLVAIVFELAYEVADLAELARHRDELLIDQPLLPVELGAGPQPFLFEQGPVRIEHERDQLVRVGWLAARPDARRRPCARPAESTIAPATAPSRHPASTPSNTAMTMRRP